MTDSDDVRARLVGLNHVALEVGDVGDALDFYGSIFAFDLRSRGDSAAFVDMGDQFVAFAEGGGTGEDDHRHVGLVVDDKEAVRRRLDDLGIDVSPAGGLTFPDPWGNRLQVVGYRDVQFTKADHVLDGMDLDLEKSAAALEELGEKGMAPR